MYDVAWVGCHAFVGTFAWKVVVTCFIKAAFARRLILHNRFQRNHIHFCLFMFVMRRVASRQGRAGRIHYALHDSVEVRYG